MSRHPFVIEFGVECLLAPTGDIGTRDIVFDVRGLRVESSRAQMTILSFILAFMRSTHLCGKGSNDVGGGN